MALIMLAELLTAKSEAEQLSPGVLPAVSGPAALITGGAVRRGEARGVLRHEGGGRQMS